MEGALQGIKVLDLSMFLSGPRATQILADFGAEVVKVEPPEGETMRGWMMLVPGLEDTMNQWHRNKQCISLNIRNPEGADILRQLIGKFDVLVENFAPGTMEKLGLSYDDLKKIHPGLIYASISGFGKNSPNSDRVAFDMIAQATGGIMSALGMEDRSPGVMLGDYVSGAYTTIGILTALRHRDKTGEGQFIDVSMQDVMYFNNFAAAEARMKRENEEGEEADQFSIVNLLAGEEPVAFWRPYKTGDGYVAVVFVTDRQWQNMCDVIGKPECGKDPRFSNVIARVQNKELIEEMIDEWMQDKSAAEIEVALDAARIPCGRVLGLKEVNDDPNLIAREMITEVSQPDGRKIPVPGIPIKLSKSPGKIESSCPGVGGSNLEVYKEYLGFDEDDLQQLREKGAI